MHLVDTALAGCSRIVPDRSADARGGFVKTFHEGQFASAGLPLMWREEYYSSSRRNVIRGMHFQSPPDDHEKVVYCQVGRALDVVVDLRVDSSTYGRYIAVELDAARGDGIFVPKGMAHGFLALSDDVLMAYKVTSVYAPESDAGIAWDSFGFDWGVTAPIISERDRRHPSLASFQSPFRPP